MKLTIWRCDRLYLVRDATSLGCSLDEVTMEVVAVDVADTGGVPRSQGKAVRIVDMR